MTARLMERHPRRCPQRAFTLVEMLIAMALTLIMVGAIAEFYAYVGETVKDGRAMIEINGLMRAAVQRLKSDLDSVTAQAIPWADEGSGYIEIFEGRTFQIPGSSPAQFVFPASDCDANGNNILDAVESVADADGNGVPDWAQYGISNLTGDGDDVFAATIRANGQPLTGRFFDTSTVTHKIITAQHAEVIWWVGFNDVSPTNGLWDMIEPRQVYRRQLLIRPDLGRLCNTSGYPFTTAGLTGTNGALQSLLEWFQVSDVSASIRVEKDSSNNDKFFIRANSLADLSRREYRFGHLQYRSGGSGLVDNFPYPFDLTPNSTVSVPISAVSPNATVISTIALQNIPNAQNPTLLFSNTNYATPSTSQGEDIVLSNVLAFDLRVYDPQAQVISDGASLAAFLPGDPGYYDAIKNNSYTTIGTGAFVDLGYGTQLVNMGIAANSAALKNSYFAFANKYYSSVTLPNSVVTPALGATWDTWTWWYERDGVDNNGDNFVDSATNGLDDDNANGVDDANEREANPPYARALRGLEVKIRMYEPGTRQVRQATVGTDFVAE